MLKIMSSARRKPISAWNFRSENHQKMVPAIIVRGGEDDGLAGRRGGVVDGVVELRPSSKASIMRLKW